MILLVTPSSRVQECVTAIEQASTETVQVAPSLQQAATRLRSQEYSAVVLDQTVLEAEPDASEAALQHLGTAIPVHINFAVSGVERVIREVRAALNRRKREVTVARQEAEQVLRSELKGSVTALLLSCEIALRVPDLSPAAENKLRAVYEIAQAMRAKLAVGG